MWLKRYDNLKILGGEMNELYKFEGVLKPNFYQRSFIIISNRFAVKIYIYTYLLLAECYNYNSSIRL